MLHYALLRTFDRAKARCIKAGHGRDVLNHAMAVVGFIGGELLVFACVGFVVGGASDMLLDVVWMVRALWRYAVVYRRYDRASTLTLAAVDQHAIALFIPAWQEADVIAAMLRHAIQALGIGDWRIFVGAYPNDPSTIAAVRGIADDRVALVLNPGPGPTTKADCLNAIWHHMIDLERVDPWRAEAVVLHDAQDVVHPGELGLYNYFIGRFDLVQIPVVPLIDHGSRWVSGHYNDEFAESHGRTLVVREALGAGIPAAGVGCAFGRRMLDVLASRSDEGPFASASLTEDYELGLRVDQLGGRAAFVRLPTKPGGPMVAVHAHFPATIDAAVRQKARWIVGIALMGWDRLGWSGGLAEHWMRLHDRRALLSALVLMAAYLGAIMTVIVFALQAVGLTAASLPMSMTVRSLLIVSSALLAWRLAMRALLVGRVYGWVEGLRSAPRSIIANIIAVMAAYRAVGLYLRIRREGSVAWDKTAHRFPDSPPA